MFSVDTYSPFLKTLWSSIQREISHKTDDELRMTAYEALSVLTKKLSTSVNTDKSFENFVKGINISMQTAIAEASTVAQFSQASKVLLTVANASKESCIIVVQIMVPAMITFYEFNTSQKIQIACLFFLGDLSDLASHWGVENNVESHLKEIPNLCLSAVSNPQKDYQVAGFKTLMKVVYILKADLILPFLDVLIFNVQNAQDEELITVSVQTIHCLARKFPELIMDSVVKGKCDINNLTKDKSVMTKRLNLLCNLASIDDFTKLIIEEMLRIIHGNDSDDVKEVIKSLSACVSNESLYSVDKVCQIETEIGIIDSIVTWMVKEICEMPSMDIVIQGLSLISNTMSTLSEEKQRNLLAKHTQNILEHMKNQEMYFLILTALYNSLRQSIYEANFHEILKLCLQLCFESENEYVRTRACILVSHFINKVSDSELHSVDVFIQDTIKKFDSKINESLTLNAYLTKALIIRGSSLYENKLMYVSINLYMLFVKRYYRFIIQSFFYSSYQSIL